jgi:uncharacterized protein involved in outer membrane biogenesis
VLQAVNAKNLLNIAKRRRRLLTVLASVLAIYTLSGFFVAPWLIKSNVVSGARDALGVTLNIDRIAINPYVLSLEVLGLELDDPEGAPLTKIDRVFVNFQLSSIFRWAWTFREFRVEGLEVFVRRGHDGAFNFAFLMNPDPAADTEEREDAASGSPPRLLVSNFAIIGSVVNWNDAVPPEPVETQIGPVDITLDDLNTLPDRAGQQAVMITTESSGTMGWSGSLELNPLRAEGHASIQGSHFPLTSAYHKHASGFDIVDGLVDIELDYRIDASADTGLEATVSGFELLAQDLRVMTFNAASGASDEDREILKLPEMRLSGGELHWPEQTVSASSLAINDAVVSLLRTADGQLDILPAKAEEEPDFMPSAPSAPWHLSLGQFDIKRLALDLEDQSVEPTATVGLQTLDLSIRDISNDPLAAFPTKLDLTARTGGTVSLEGVVTALPELHVDVNVLIKKLMLAGADPYLKELADVNLDDGALNLEARLESSIEDPMRFTGDLEIVDFLITETEKGSRLGSWSSLYADNLLYSIAEKRLDVSEVRFDQPYSDVLIAEDGSVNLGRVSKGETTQDSDDAEVTADESAPGIAITIGRIKIIEGAADFADRSLPLPFDANIEALNGEISTIVTTSSEPAVISLEGSVDEYGSVKVSGALTPFNPSDNTDVQVVFRNVDVPKFSAYTIPFAGREIATGRLDLDLGYKVTEGALVGENKVTLREFELGKKVDHPGAMSLPLGLAVALLKDAEGKIDIDLPVRGNINDPEFGYGRVVGKALMNLIVKIVASPFALLGNLIGAEADDLQFFQFASGRADLSPPEVEKAVKIAEALTLRPNIVLIFNGVYEPERDGAALREQKFEQIIEGRLAMSPDDSESTYADQRLQILEELFTESGLATEPGIALDELRGAHTQPAREDADKQFDALAYASALSRQLVDAQSLAEDDLLVLALSRAENVRSAILMENIEIGDRLLIEQSSSVSQPKDDEIRMEIRLTVGEELAELIPASLNESGNP